MTPRKINKDWDETSTLLRSEYLSTRERLFNELEKREQENKKLQEKRDAFADEVRELDVENTRLAGIVDSQQKDMLSLRSMRLSRKIGAGLLTFCGAVAPLFMLNNTLFIIYYCLISVAVTSIFWGVWHSRNTP